MTHKTGLRIASELRIFNRNIRQVLIFVRATVERSPRKHIRRRGFATGEIFRTSTLVPGVGKSDSTRSAIRSAMVSIRWNGWLAQTSATAAATLRVVDRVLGWSRFAQASGRRSGTRRSMESRCLRCALRGSPRWRPGSRFSEIRILSGMPSIGPSRPAVPARQNPVSMSCQ